MAGVMISPASLLDLIAEIVEMPVNDGVFKEDCADLTRGACLLTHLVEEIRDSKPIDSDASSSLENDWWSDLVVGLQAAKRLLSSADGAAKPWRISYQFQSVACKLEKALSILPYDLYEISDEVGQQVELARSQLRRAMQRYWSLNSEKFSSALSEPLERDASFSNITEEDLAFYKLVLGDMKKETRDLLDSGLFEKASEKLERMIEKEKEKKKKNKKQQEETPPGAAEDEEEQEENDDGGQTLN